MTFLRYQKVTIMGDLKKFKKKGCRTYGCNGSGNTVPVHKYHRSKKNCPHKSVSKRLGIKQKPFLLEHKFDSLDKEINHLEENLNNSYTTQNEEVIRYWNKH